MNPTLLVEVLSPSTEDYDQGEKLLNYKQVPSLMEIALVAHDAQRIDVWRREGASWSRTTFEGAAEAELSALGVVLPLQEVFRNPLEE